MAAKPALDQLRAAIPHGNRLSAYEINMDFHPPPRLRRPVREGATRSVLPRTAFAQNLLPLSMMIWLNKLVAMEDLTEASFTKATIPARAQNLISRLRASNPSFKYSSSGTQGI